MRKKVSIVTINYNNALGLKKTIQSVSSQSSTDFDFVVIDGKSTDESLQIIQENEAIITAYLSESDTGVYDAMNKGIKLCSGEFIIFMNSGDLFYDATTLERCIPLLNSTYGIYYGDAIMFDDKERFQYSYPDVLSFSFFYDKTLCHQSSFIKKELFEQLGYYNSNKKIVSDWEFFVKAIILNKIPYKHLSQNICQYELTGLSSLASNSEQTKLEKQSFFEEHFSFFIDDYAAMQVISKKRIQQIVYVSGFSIPWRLLKWATSFFLLFLPKFKATTLNTIRINKIV